MNGETFLRALAEKLVRQGYQNLGRWRDVGSDATSPPPVEEDEPDDLPFFLRYARPPLGAVPLNLADYARATYARRIAPAFDPVMKACDLVGYREGANAVFVILGDRLTAIEIAGRFSRIEAQGGAVASLGRRSGRLTLPTWLLPIVVYFDEDVCSRHAGDLLELGWQTSPWSRHFLRAAVVDVPNRTVRWAPQRGPATFGYALGAQHEPLTPADLDAILSPATA